MLPDKAISLCVLELLREYTDENHTLSTQEIIRKLNAEYHYEKKIDRRTIYSAIDTLEEVGYEVSRPADNGKGYYLAENLLEPAEAKLLTDAVCSFPFISERQTEQILKKVQKMLSMYERKTLNHLTVVRQEKKTSNKSVLLNVEMLDEAIENRRKVEFDYCSYGVDKLLHKRREEKYVVNPHGTVYTNEFYYLICTMPEHEGTAMYRLDRIQNLKILDEEADKLEKGVTPQSIVETAVYAHTGTPESVELLIDKSVLNDVIDKFGTEIHVSEVSDNQLRVIFRAATKGLKYWALQYLEHVEVVRPEGLREEITMIISFNKYWSKNK